MSTVSQFFFSSLFGLPILMLGARAGACLQSRSIAYKGPID